MKTKSAKTLLQNKLANKSFAKTYHDIEFLVYIGLTIAKYRDKAGLTQGQLAKKVGTTQSVISRIENGNQNLSLNTLAMIAQVLKCELSVNLKPTHVTR